MCVCKQWLSCHFLTVPHDEDTCVFLLTHTIGSFILAIIYFIPKFPITKIKCCQIKAL